MSKIYQTFYCDFGFIQKVVSKEILFKHLNVFFRNLALNNHVKLVLNIPDIQKRRILEKERDNYTPFDDLIFTLVSSSRHQYIEDIKGLKKFISEHNYNVIVFGETRIEELASYGIVAINSSMLTIDFLNNLTVEKGRYLEKAKNMSWREILPKSVNQCNSIIVIDQYIIQEADKLKHNINAILEMVIPEKLNIEFHIAIFCNFYTSNKGYNVEKRFNEILTFLDKKNVSITLYNSKKEFHDRYVITNNHFIESGAGFDIFNNSQNLVHSTIIRSCYPFLISSNDKFQSIAYRHILNKLTKIKESSNSQFFSSNNEKTPHRLIDQFNKMQ